MNRPTVLIASVGAAILVAAAGVSAHTGFLVRLAGVSHSQFGDQASGARLESPEPSDSPEPTDSPEASPTPEPAEQPEASPTAEPAEAPEASDTEAGDVDGPTGTTSTSGGD